MRLHDSQYADSHLPRKRCGSAARNAITLVALVVIIGGIAWVAQYLPTWSTPKPVVPAPSTAKLLLEFPRYIAQWYPPLPAKKEGDEPTPTDKYPAKHFEQGTSGHYDFPFKNTSEKDVEIVYYTSDCDCASVEACSLPGPEIDRLIAIHNDNPGMPLPYTGNPAWKKLSREVINEAIILVKAGEGGVVRVNFDVKKSPGQQLNVRPTVWYQPVGETSQRGGQGVIVPVTAKQPVLFQPARISVGEMSPNSVVHGKLIAWSSTRSNLKLDLTNARDPFFEVEIQPLAKEEMAKLEESLKEEKLTAKVMSAVEVNVKVHESKDGKHLDLGSFYRRLPVSLDGFFRDDVQGPEVVGRVKGDLFIGGANDESRVRFKSFDAETGGKKIVEISADANATLSTYTHQPSWVEVKLYRDEKNVPAKRRIWILEVRVPPNTPAARSFEEPDAIVLRVTTGEVERLVRIPIEGHVGGQ
jgi:hypothetical protein